MVKIAILGLVTCMAMAAQAIRIGMGGAYARSPKLNPNSRPLSLRRRASATANMASSRTPPEFPAANVSLATFQVEINPSEPVDWYLLQGTLGTARTFVEEKLREHGNVQVPAFDDPFGWVPSTVPGTAYVYLEARSSDPHHLTWGELSEVLAQLYSALLVHHQFYLCTFEIYSAATLWGSGLLQLDHVPAPHQSLPIPGTS